MGKILVIDDDDDNASMLSYLFSEEGHQVTTVVDPSIINLVISGDVPDLIIMDVKLGEVDGRDVCRSIKADSDLKHVKVLLISAFPDVFDPLKNDSGADAFIAKPFDIDEVVSMVGGLMMVNK